MFRWFHTECKRKFQLDRLTVGFEAPAFWFEVIEVAAYLSASLFNEGNLTLLLVMNELKIVIGTSCFSYALEMNEQRVS